MPWDYKTNKPDSVKYLHPKIQRKAIAIANAIVREGGDDGTAIAVGIKKAKGLVKLAANPFLNRRRLNRLVDAIQAQDPDMLKQVIIPKVILDELN